MRRCVNKHDLVTTPDIGDSHLQIQPPPPLICCFLLPPPLDMESQLFCKHSNINLHLICLVIVLSDLYPRRISEMFKHKTPKRHLVHIEYPWLSKRHPCQTHPNKHKDTTLVLHSTLKLYIQIAFVQGFDWQLKDVDQQSVMSTR